MEEIWTLCNCTKQIFLNKLKISETIENSTQEKHVTYLITDNPSAFYNNDQMFIDKIVIFLRKYQDFMYKVLVNCKTVEGKKYDYASVKGGHSDTATFSEYMNAANLSVGYYNPHSKTEFVIIQDMLNTFNYLCVLAIMIIVLKYNKKKFENE